MFVFFFTFKSSLFLFKASWLPGLSKTKEREINKQIWRKRGEKKQTQVCGLVTVSNVFQLFGLLPLTLPQCEQLARRPPLTLLSTLLTSFHPPC